MPRAPSYSRERRNVPLTGDWRQVAVLSGLEVPKLPHRSPAWCAAVKRAWVSWWSDGVAVLWGPADVTSLEQAAELLQQSRTSGEAKWEGQLRARLDGLGLTPLGKHRLRLVAIAESEAVVVDSGASELELKRRERDAQAAAQ